MQNSRNIESSIHIHTLNQLTYEDVYSTSKRPPIYLVIKYKNSAHQSYHLLFMDPATVLEDYLSEITNLPTDLAFILDEIHGYEEQLRDVQRKTLQRETINQKFIKTHGSLAENPKEAASTPRIRQEYQQALAIQEDKCNLANTGLYIVSRYVKRLEDQIRVLERDGVIPQMQIESLGEVFMPVKHTRRERPSTSSRSSHTPRQSNGGPVQQSPNTPARTHTAASGERLLRRQRLSEEHEEEKYCICNQKSFGDMVGCDNDNCPNEWFHWECVGLTEAPTGIWFCPSCRKK